MKETTKQYLLLLTLILIIVFGFIKRPKNIEILELKIKILKHEINNVNNLYESCKAENDSLIKPYKK